MFLFFFIHGVGIGILGGIGYLIDIGIRYNVVRSNKNNSHQCKIIRLPSHIIKIEFKKGNFKYKGG